MNLLRNQDFVADEQPTSSDIAKLISGWYVRRDSKFYDIDRPTVKMSKDDVQRACLHRLAEKFPGLDLTDREVLKEAFYRAIDQKHTIPGESIRVWDGSTVCIPGDAQRLLHHQGIVSLNSWREPAYRSCTEAVRNCDLAYIFIGATIPRAQEREKFLTGSRGTFRTKATSQRGRRSFTRRRRARGRAPFASLRLSCSATKTRRSRTTSTSSRPGSIRLCCRRNS